MTPEKLAAELGIKGRWVRAWLVKTFPREASNNTTAWNLTEDQITAARSRWSPAKPATRTPTAPSPAAAAKGKGKTKAPAVAKGK